MADFENSLEERGLSREEINRQLVLMRKYISPIYEAIRDKNSQAPISNS
jgi:uncharacterized protein YnzC (UPF0291/DUF896 family)